MPRIVDPMGVPMGANSQPQGAAINPVLQMLWPLFSQNIHDLVSAGVQPPEKVVATAWEIANRAFQHVGLEFVFPMGVKVISPRALHESDREHADAAEAGGS